VILDIAAAIAFIITIPSTRYYGVLIMVAGLILTAIDIFYAVAFTKSLLMKDDNAENRKKIIAISKYCLATNICSIVSLVFYCSYFFKSLPILKALSYFAMSCINVISFSLSIRLDKMKAKASTGIDPSTLKSRTDAIGASKTMLGRIIH
jgi:hypothetical protein